MSLSRDIEFRAAVRLVALPRWGTKSTYTVPCKARRIGSLPIKANPLTIPSWHCACNAVFFANIEVAARAELERRPHLFEA